MIRDAVAALSGIVVAFGLFYVLQFVGNTIYPPPVGLDQTDVEAMRAYISTLPIPALLIPMFAYFLAAFAGTLVACTIGTARPAVFAFIIGVLLLARTVTTLILVPHPLWYSITVLLGVIGSAWLAMTMAPGKGSVAED